MTAGKTGLAKRKRRFPQVPYHLLVKMLTLKPCRIDKLIFVIGMHRCGSSLLTSCLEKTGYIYVKEDEKFAYVAASDECNPLGYFENGFFGGIHEKLLLDNGSSWRSPPRGTVHFDKSDVKKYVDEIRRIADGSDGACFVIKDPRLSFLYEFTQAVGAELGCNVSHIFCTRHRAEVISSLVQAEKRRISKANHNLIERPLITVSDVGNIYDMTHLHYQNTMLLVDHSDLLYDHEKTMRMIANFCSHTYVDTSDLVEIGLHREKIGFDGKVGLSAAWSASGEARVGKRRARGIYSEAERSELQQRLADQEAADGGWEGLGKEGLRFNSIKRVKAQLAYEWTAATNADPTTPIGDAVRKKPRINYVIATYEGTIGQERGSARREPMVASVTLDIHIRALMETKHDLSQITIMKAACKGPKTPGYYDILDGLGDINGIPIVTHECENYGYSNGQWLKAYEIYQSQFDYYIFIEDDYCPNMDGFDDLFVSCYHGSFPGNSLGILSAHMQGGGGVIEWWRRENILQYGVKFPLHYEGPLITSKETLLRLYKSREFDGGPRECLSKFPHIVECSRGYVLGGWYQVAFSQLFTQVGVQHASYVDDLYEGGILSFPYWDDNSGKIWFYDKKDKKLGWNRQRLAHSPFVPVQVATPALLKRHFRSCMDKGILEAHLTRKLAKVKAYKSYPSRGADGQLLEREAATETGRGKIIFVLGMHRCGTSLLTSCLEKSGYSIGKSRNKDMDIQNPRGYFENDRFTEAHNALLAFNECDWKSPKRGMGFTKQHVSGYCALIEEEFHWAEQIVIKDPRLTFFGDFLDEVVESIDRDVYYLFCTRDQREVIHSLVKAQGVTQSEASRLYSMTHECKRPKMLTVNHRDLVYENARVMNVISQHCSHDYRDTRDLVRQELHREKASALPSRGEEKKEDSPKKEGVRASRGDVRPKPAPRARASRGNVRPKPAPRERASRGNVRPKPAPRERASRGNVRPKPVPRGLARQKKRYIDLVRARLLATRGSRAGSHRMTSLVHHPWWYGKGSH